MSTLDVVAEILREVAPRALKAREITALAGTRLLTSSRTPETVVSRDLAVDVKTHGASSRFLRVDRGPFVLKEALPTAFYNDTDSYAAQWTRNLIAAGEIAAGVVDERSIRDLKPADVASYRQCHFFSGIGVWSRALRDAGWSDSDHVWSGSCPCQPLSQAGKRRGFADERHLWPEWFRLIKACRPALLFTEQVSSKDDRTWLDSLLDDLEGIDYACQAYALPACSVGAPHKRERLYVVAYARERGREILSAAWIHDRGQRGHDAPRRGETLGRVSNTVPDAAVARSCVPQDAGADRGDARPGAEALERRASGDLEPQRGGADDGAGAVFGTASAAERVEWDAGWSHGPHGRAELEPVGLPRSAWDTGTVCRTQAVGTGSSSDCASEDRVVRGATVVAGDSSDGNFCFQPGDRIRIADDPSWGGAVRGYWAHAVEWIYCRPAPGHQDGCWRPARAGIKPLVDGLAPGMGPKRAARIRGYGNAIVLPLAVAFVESVIEAFADAATMLGIASAAPVHSTPVVASSVVASSVFADAAPEPALYEEVPCER